MLTPSHKRYIVLIMLKNVKSGLLNNPKSAYFTTFSEVLCSTKLIKLLFKSVQGKVCKVPKSDKKKWATANFSTRIAVLSLIYFLTREKLFYFTSKVFYFAKKTYFSKKVVKKFNFVNY